MRTIGDNIALLRRPLGVTQEALAEAAGVSVETVRKLEQNERTAARMSTLHKLARALRVPTSALLGNAAQSAARREPDIDDVALLPLRKVLTPARRLGGVAVADPEPESIPFLDDVRRSVRAVDTLYHADDYGSTLAALPSLLTEAGAAVDAVDGHDRDLALALNAQAHQVAGTTLIQLRRFDLAHRALDKALDAGDRSGDQMVAASAIVTLCWLLLRQGRFTEAEQLAVATADAIEPRFSRADPVELATWGWLMLRAAAAAVRDNRDDDAENMLAAAAAAAAARIGDRVPPDLLAPGPATIGAFCASTVSMKRVETAVIAGNTGRALELAEQVPPSDRPTSNNVNRHLLDVAYSRTAEGQYAEATETLMGIRASAPTWLRHQRLARDILRTIGNARRRAASHELAELAALMDVEI